MKEDDKALNPNIPCDAFKLKLNECNFQPALSEYLLNLFKSIEAQVNTLASFVPFMVELEIY